MDQLAYPQKLGPNRVNVSDASSNDEMFINVDECQWTISTSVKQKHQDYLFGSNVPTFIYSLLHEARGSIGH